jgi:hypothetical protein
VILSIIAVGHVHADSFAPLTTRYERIEQLVVDSDQRAVMNRAVDSASSDWILILRQREEIGELLGAEIASLTRDDARAWGYRIRTVPIYAGRPLRLNAGGGELRLFHRRHLLRRGELAVQGTVIRLAHPLTAVTFASPEEHRAYLGRTAVPHSRLRRILLFLRYARTLDRNTLRYLWIEAGFDV